VIAAAGGKPESLRIPALITPATALPVHSNKYKFGKAEDG